MAYTGPTIDTEIEHAHLHPEPCVIPYGHGPMSSGITFMAAAPPVVPFGSHNQLPFPTHQLMDGPHDAFKGKIDEGLYSYPVPGSSHIVVPEYVGFNVIPVVMGPGHHRGARNRAAGAVEVNPGIQFMPISHGALGQPVHMLPGPWLDQQFCGNVPGMPYMQVAGYTNGGPVTFVHQPLPPMPPLQPIVPRFVRTAPPTNDRVFPPHGQQLMIESNPRQRGLSHLRGIPEAEVAMLNFGNYGHRVDHHRDMRLDIDHMSYEELLALGEQIGNAGSGLSKDFILGHLKMRIFTNPEDASYVDQNLNFCTVCQMEYNDQEKIGILDCSHEYHVDCIEKWLVEKNSCPVCKCTGLAAQGKES